MSENKKAAKLLSELERTLPILEEAVDISVCLERFMSVNEKYRDQYFPHLYLSLWKLALKIGKLSIAKLFAEKSLNYLVEYKKIPQLNHLLRSLEGSGLLKEKLIIYTKKKDILLGIKPNSIEFYKDEIDLMMNHPEYWKMYPSFISNYLTLEREWTIDQWKLCYEYILMAQFDKELFLLLMDKALELNKPKMQEKFIELLRDKKIKFKKAEISSRKNKLRVEKEKLIIDYDQVAMDLLSGTIGPTEEEQRRVLNSLKFISEEELLTRGLDMVVAFELLGMEQVVVSLCEQLTKRSKEIKTLIGVYYVWAQALVNMERYFKLIELVDEVLDNQPLYGDERLAFIYLKAEACLKLKRVKMARKLYLEIKTQNPHYRSVRERLKSIETN